METAKRKTIKTSSLEKIPGIGAAKAKNLLTALGGLGAIKQADLQRLAEVKGISQRDAQAVYDHFHSKEN
jgi:excinuclease ABC subunit C